MTQPLNPLTLPLIGTRLIEASAGTGKTYTIVSLYLRLILGHDKQYGYGQPLIPPEILVVTFTNAATQELRDRIRSRLTQAAAFFRSENKGDSFLWDLRDHFSPETRTEKAWILDQAAQWMDEAAIYTIHGWAQRMLRRHAFDSNSLFDLKLEPNDIELLEEAARDYWRTYFYPLPPSFLKEILDAINCDTPQALLEKIRPLLNLPATDSQEISMEDPFVMFEKRCQAIETARQQWASDFDGAIHRLQTAKDNKILSGTKYRTASFVQWLDQLTDWVIHNGRLPEEKIRNTFSATGLRAGVNKNQTAPTHPVYDAFDRLNEQLSNLKVKPALFAHAAREIAQRYEKEKENRGQLGYDDLLARLAEALLAPGNESLARAIRKQYPVALIDEFQDTDPLQYTSFDTIYRDQQGTGLFMIGDPKQAIYAFRGADIYTYLDARRKTAGQRYTLEKNYRSTAGMVDSVNQLFWTRAKHPQGSFLFGEEIPFEAAAANGRDKKFIVDGKPLKSMHLWQLPQSEPILKTGDDGYLHRMAEAFASEMVRLLNRTHLNPPQAGFLEADGLMKPLKPGDLAVLVRNRQEARTIRNALNKRGIKSVFLSDKDSVFKTDEAEDLLFLLRACATPGRDDLLRAALATPILSLSMYQLDNLNQDEEAWEEQVERFNRYRQIWHHQGVLPMLRTIFHEYRTPAHLLSSDNGERCLTNLLHLSELLQSASVSVEGASALVQWLSDQIRDPKEGLEEEILRLESDADVVRVITIHKSKGLEFPLVFLPFICSYRQVTLSNTPLVTCRDEQGRKRLVTDPSDQDLAAADRERLAEDLRLLYVAVTRAQFCCWLGVAMMGKTTKKDGEKGTLHLSSFGYLLAGEKSMVTSQLRESLEILQGDCEEIDIAPLPRPDDGIYVSVEKKTAQGTAREFSGHVPSDWSITSYSGIVAGAGHKEDSTFSKTPEKRSFDAAESAIEDQLHETGMILSEPARPETTKRSIHSFPRGPQPGILLHDLLEWAANNGFEAVAHDRKNVADHIRSLCRRNDWEPWEEVLSDWFHRFLQTPIVLPEQQESLRLAQLPKVAYQAELEFLFSAHGVDTRMMDDAITTHILPGASRPKLKPSLVNGMLKGFIDLAFCYKDRYFVLDYKSNHLGNDDSAYGTDALTEAILEHRYDLQYVLYTLAMHRQLKARLPGYAYEKHMGGGVYLFLRGVNTDGKGVFVDRPPWPLIERLDIAFAGQEANRVA